MRFLNASFLRVRLWLLIFGSNRRPSQKTKSISEKISKTIVDRKKVVIVLFGLRVKPGIFFARIATLYCAVDCIVWRGRVSECGAAMPSGSVKINSITAKTIKHRINILASSAINFKTNLLPEKLSSAKRTENLKSFLIFVTSGAFLFCASKPAPKMKGCGQRLARNRLRGWLFVVVLTAESDLNCKFRLRK